MDEARALIERTPVTCYLCVRMRGAIAAVAGDAASADRWYAEALRQGPSLPFAEAEWAQALLARGDTAGAIAKATAANRKGPHFADPLQVWGEALLKKGDAKGAAAKFAEADKYAPRWGRNHLLWGESLAATGKTAEANVQWRIASGLDLTPDERARLATHLGAKT
jgi:predicted Zn-dependent protease